MWVNMVELSEVLFSYFSADIKWRAFNPAQYKTL